MPTYNFTDVETPQKTSSGTYSFKDLSPAQHALAQKSLQAPSVMDTGVDRAIDQIRPFLPWAATAGVTAATGGADIPAAALAGGATAAYGMLDAIAQRMRSGHPDYSPTSSLTNFVASETLPKVLTRGASSMLGYTLEKAAPGSVAGLKNLAGTFGQHMESQGNRALSNVSNWIEDLFYGKGKQEAINLSKQLGGERLTDVMTGISGRTASAVNNPQWMSQSLRIKLANNDIISRKASNEAAQTAVMLSQGVKQDIPITAAEAASVPPNTVRIISGPQGSQFIHTVEGPTNLSEMATTAKQFIDDKLKLYSTVDNIPADERKLFNIAQSTLDHMGAKFDPQTGQLLGVRPMSFRDAWTYKQGLDELAQPTFDQNGQAIYSNANRIARNFSNAVSNGIEDSMQKWGPSGTAAQNAYLTAKAIVHQRQEVFRNVGSFMNGYNSAVPMLDKIVNDPERLASAIKTGSLDLIPGTKLQVTKNDLASYKLFQMFQDAKGSGDKLVDAWKDPAFQDSKTQLYSSATRTQLDQLFKDLQATQYKTVGLAGSSRNMIWATRAGIMLAPALVTGVATGSTDYAAGMLGMEIGGAALGRMLVNPDKARLLAAAVKGVPLGMSNEKAMRVLMNGLQGATVSVINQQGQRTPMQVDQDGNINQSIR